MSTQDKLAVIQGPRDILFQPDAIAPWAAHAAMYADPNQLVRRANALLYSTQQTAGDSWNPNAGELKLALISLVSMGLDLAPTAQECALLSFWNKKTKQHSVTPVIMKEGLRRIASELHPIRGEHAGVVVDGDEWWCKRTQDGLKFEHDDSHSEASRVSLISSSGALNFKPVRALYATIYFADGSPAFSEVLGGERLHEKLRANRNIWSASKYSPWATNTYAMLVKTIIKTTYRLLPLRGRPAASMRLGAMAEGRQLGAMRDVLLSDARERALPPVATDGLEAITIAEPVHDDNDAPDFDFEAQPPIGA